MTGAGLVAHIFSVARGEWNSRPDITTIESVTRPVEELRFPAVTVCRSADVPADAMAAAAKHLSPLAFQCGVRSRRRIPEDCGDTDVVREAFAFLFEFALDLMDGRIGEIFDSGSEGELLPAKLLSAIETHAKMFEHIMGRNVSTYDSLREDVRLNFTAVTSANYFKALKEAHGLPSSLKNFHPGIVSAGAKKLAALALLSLSDMGSFGSFFTEILPLLDKRYFSQEEHRALSIKPSMCSDVPEEVAFIHDFLANLTRAINSRIVGGGERELWYSAFDVPNLVSLQPFKVIYKERKVSWPVHSACRHFDNDTWSSLSDSRSIYNTCGKMQEKHLYQSGPDPCRRWNGTFCCDAGAVLKLGDLPLVMAIMRHANHGGRTMEDLAEYVEGVAPMLGYPVFPMGRGPSHMDRNTLPHGKDHLSMIPACEYVDHGNRGTRNGRRIYPTCRGLFRPAVTDVGICRAFNSLPLEDLLRPSGFVSAMKAAYGAEVLPDNGTELLRAVEYSDEMGLTFYLDRQMLFRNYWRDSDHLSVAGAFKVTFADQERVA